MLDDQGTGSGMDSDQSKRTKQDDGSWDSSDMGTNP